MDDDWVNVLSIRRSNLDDRVWVPATHDGWAIADQTCFYWSGGLRAVKRWAEGLADGEEWRWVRAGADAWYLEVRDPVLL